MTYSSNCPAPDTDTGCTRTRPGTSVSSPRSIERYRCWSTTVSATCCRNDSGSSSTWGAPRVVSSTVMGTTLLFSSRGSRLIERSGVGEREYMLCSWTFSASLRSSSEAIDSSCAT